jgi:hypothetical protein
MSASESDASSVEGDRSEDGKRKGPVALVGRALERLRTTGSDGMRVGEDPAIKSGWLMKRGERRKAWKKRWFVLRGGQVAMYKTDQVRLPFLHGDIVPL